VVTNVLYELHPPTNITSTYWFIEGFENAPDQGAAAVPAWLKYWIKVSPDIDPRFGGFFSASGVHLAFAGTLEEARAAFLDEFQEWYFNELLPISNFVENQYGALPPLSVTTEQDSWYAYKGGADGYNNPDATDATGDSYEGVEFINARLVPESILREKPDEMLDFLLDLLVNRDGIGGINYFLGGKIGDVGDEDTSVHPALRKAAWNLFVNPGGVEKMYEFLPNTITGACFNHHSPVEPDWKDALWGDSQYGKLLELKGKYDPDGVFNCWHCVGYTGEENPDTGAPANQCPGKDSAARGVLTFVSFLGVALSVFLS